MKIVVSTIPNNQIESDFFPASVAIVTGSLISSFGLIENKFDVLTTFPLVS